MLIMPHCVGLFAIITHTINIVPCELKVGVTGCTRLELGAECLKNILSLFVLIKIQA